MRKPMTALFALLTTADWTYERLVGTSAEVRDRADRLSRQTHRDVLIFRMVGAIRVQYVYEANR